MNPKLVDKLEKANAEKDAIHKVFKKIGAKKPKDLDDNFQVLHTETFKKLDCLTCANCCKTTSPIFRDVDIKRIAKNLRMKEKEFIRNYLKMDDEDDFVLQSSPCSFLGNDNKCGIYEFRPLACREYPHADRKNMHQILDLTAKNMEICPAVADIVLQITNKYS